MPVLAALLARSASLAWMKIPGVWVTLTSSKNTSELPTEGIVLLSRSTLKPSRLQMVVAKPSVALPVTMFVAVVLVAKKAVGRGSTVAV